MTDDRYLTTTELAERMAAQARTRKQRRDRELMKRYGACPVCGAPRFAEARYGKFVGFVCTEEPRHTPSKGEA